MKLPERLIFCHLFCKIFGQKRPSLPLFLSEGFVGPLDIETVLVDRLAESRGVDREAAQRTLMSDGAIDSLEGIELIFAAEEVFGITVSDDEIASAVCRSVSALAGLVNSKLVQ